MSRIWHLRGIYFTNLVYLNYHCTIGRCSDMPCFLDLDVHFMPDIVRRSFTYISNLISSQHLECTPASIRFLFTNIFCFQKILILGISGAALTYALTPSSSPPHLGDTILNKDMSTIQGLFVEFILTFVLTLTVYSASGLGPKFERYHSSLMYGLAVVMCNLVGVSDFLMSILLILIL